MRDEQVMLSGCTKKQAFARGLTGLLVTLWLGLALSPSLCLADTPTHYLNMRNFVIPYAIDANESLNLLRLHASTNGKDFSEVASTKQRNGEFPYKATGDGVYFFVVQLEDGNGQLRPPNVQAAVPTMRVVVDTERPKIALRAVQAQGARAAVEWRIDDRYPDLRTLRVEARGPGETVWTPLKTEQLQYAQFNWNPPGNGPYEVRLTVSDLSKNEATATTQVTPGAVAQGAAPAPTNDNIPVVYVKEKTFKLTYKIADAGPSSVKHVEVWMTHDRSQWQRFALAQASGPHEVTVSSPGRFGFTLRPISGVGRGPAAPRAGDSPQLWVEVDLTKPVVQISNVVVGEGADKDKLIINWRASDAFLKDQPIRLQFRKSASATEQWQQLGEKEYVENSGSIKVTPPEGTFELFVRVEAVDKAGNVGFAETKEAVKVDLSVPRVVEIKAEVGIAQPPSQSPP